MRIAIGKKTLEIKMICKCSGHFKEIHRKDCQCKEFKDWGACRRIYG